MRKWLEPSNGGEGRDSLMQVTWSSDESEVYYTIQMIKGEHVYFLCADVGGYSETMTRSGTETSSYFIDGAVKTGSENIIKIVYLLFTRLFFIYLAAFVLMYLMVKRTVAQPIQLLEKATKSFSGMTNELDDPHQWVYDQPDIHTKDEIQSLAETFYELASSMKQAAISLMEESANRERIKTELSLATNIQKNALVSEFPAFPDREDFNIIATMIPAKEVGGDFYDFFLIDDDHLAFLVADVSSKGVPAALFMMQAKTMLRSGLEYSTAVEKVFTRVNDRLCEGNEENMFVTSWMAVLELSTGKLSYANAGHEPAYLLRDDKCEEIPTKTGLVLAAFSGMDYEYDSINLQHGDRVFLYTDGLNEAQTEKSELYGLERVMKSAERHSKETIEAMQESILMDMEAFVDGADQFDDVTILIFEYR